MAENEIDLEGDVPQKKSKLPLIIAAVVVLVGGGAGAFLFLGKGGGEAAAADAGAKLSADELGKLMPIESFIVNLNEAKSTRYLKITFSIELADDSVEEMVRTRKDVIRDRVLTYLSGLTIDDVRGSEPKETIREMVTVKVNEGLGADGAVRTVLFTEFVVQ